MSNRSFEKDAVLKGIVSGKVKTKIDTLARSKPFVDRKIFRHISKPIFMIHSKIVRRTGFPRYIQQR